MKPTRIAVLPFGMVLVVLCAVPALAGAQAFVGGAAPVEPAHLVCEVDTGLTVEKSAEGSCTFGLDLDDDDVGRGIVSAGVTFTPGTEVRVGIDVADPKGGAIFSDWSKSGEIEFDRVSNHRHHTVTVQDRSGSTTFDLGVTYCRIDDEPVHEYAPGLYETETCGA